MGKQDDCRVGVLLIGVAPAGSALLDHRPYPPGARCEETPEALARREKAHTPEGVAFAPKARIAAELARGVAVLGQAHLDWVVADEEYGEAGHSHDARDELGRKYVLEVPTSTTAWTEDPAGCAPESSGKGRRPTAPIRAGVPSVAAVAAGLPAGAWRALKVREGACGPLVVESAAVRAWAMRDRKPGPPAWVLIRRSLEASPEVKYCISNGEAETPPKVLAPVACSRSRVEEFFESCKSYLGMAQYETRSYAGWHHHMASVALAHLFVTLTRVRPRKSRGSRRWIGRRGCRDRRSRPESCPWRRQSLWSSTTSGGTGSPRFHMTRAGMPGTRASNSCCCRTSNVLVTVFRPR